MIATYKKITDIFERVLFPIICLLFLLFVFYLIHKIFIGDIPLWYDPARDLLSAWGNLSKPTLIGPPSGIPGVFYGPYWIWLLSFGMLFSHDPRIIIFITAAIPYLVLFPLILLGSRIFNPKTAILLSILFLLSYNSYATSLWNPNPAPLLLLLVIVLIERMRFDTWFVKDHIQAFISGISLGLLMNFHLSLGIGVLFGTLLYFLFRYLSGMRKKKKLRFTIRFGIQKIFFGFGFLVAFAPFLVFEIRHQFIQTKVLLNTFFHYGGTITLKGLTKTEIISMFFGKTGELLRLPHMLALLLLLAAVCYTAYAIYKKRITLKEKDIRLLLILFFFSFGILFIYLTARNPVWSYHFIAVSILFLLFTGFLMQKTRVIYVALLIWVFILLCQFTITLPGLLQGDPGRIQGDLVAEKHIVFRIAKDAGSRPYTVYGYSPSIYTYEYSYLFRWLENKDFSYDPGKITRQGSVYLILPNGKKALINDFVHYRSPNDQYVTSHTWVMKDGTRILKRVKQQ